MKLLNYQSERAARKARILQMTTMYTVVGGALLNLGAFLSSEGYQLIAKGSFIGAGDHDMFPPSSSL